MTLTDQWCYKDDLTQLLQEILDNFLSRLIISFHLSFKAVSQRYLRSKGVIVCAQRSVIVNKLMGSK